MSEKNARIISRKAENGQREISVVDNQGTEHRTGMRVPDGASEATIRQLKDSLERAGNNVNVVEKD